MSLPLVKVHFRNTGQYIVIVLHIICLSTGCRPEWHYTCLSLECLAWITAWARIFKRLWSPGIDFTEWIPPAYVAWRAVTITLFLYSVPSPHKLFQNSSSGMRSPAPWPWRKKGFIVQCVRIAWDSPTDTLFIRGILRGVRYAKSLRVLFLHRRSPSWTTLVLYSRAVFFFNEPTKSVGARWLYPEDGISKKYCKKKNQVRLRLRWGFGSETNR